MFKNANSKKEKKIHIAGIHHFSWGGGVAEEGGGRGGVLAGGGGGSGQDCKSTLCCLLSLIKVTTFSCRQAEISQSFQSFLGG